MLNFVLLFVTKLSPAHKGTSCGIYIEIFSDYKNDHRRIYLTALFRDVRPVFPLASYHAVTAWIVFGRGALTHQPGTYWHLPKNRQLTPGQEMSPADRADSMSAR
jgi:hypothetical protein